VGGGGAVRHSAHALLVHAPHSNFSTPTTTIGASATLTARAPVLASPTSNFGALTVEGTMTLWFVAGVQYRTLGFGGSGAGSLVLRARGGSELLINGAVKLASVTVRGLWPACAARTTGSV
jgi:hypothetical protein